MTKKELIGNIIDNVTIDDTLPIDVPKKRIARIIDKTRKKFIENDDRMTVEDILFINTSNISSGCLVIKMPENIKAIQRLEHTNTGVHAIGGFQDAYTNRYYGEYTDLISVMSVEIYNQFLKENSGRFIAYDFSEYSHELVLEGTPKRNLFAEAARIIDDAAIYGINDFEDYCSALVTLEYVKKSSFINMKLVGNRQINYDAMRKDSEKIISDIEKVWEEQKGQGVMLMD